MLSEVSIVMSEGDRATVQKTVVSRLHPRVPHNKKAP